MHLERFDPGAGGEPVRTCHRIYLAGHPYDDPGAPPMSARGFAGWLALGWTEDPCEAWRARAGPDGWAGWYVLRLPQRENRHVALLSMVVHPSRRRAGVGRALLRHAAGRARERGRTLLTGEARAGSPGAAFARAVGAWHEQTEVRRLLQLNEIPSGRLPALRAQAERAAAGYALRDWGVPAPADVLPDVTQAYDDAADAPRETGLEAQRWDPQRVRLDERRVTAMGLRRYTVAAVPPGGQGLAGLTELAVDPACPEWGFQELTVVARPHRGHRLGLLLKVAMLELLAEREPQLRWVLTGNADANQYMIAINTALGFAALDRWPAWQLAVGDGAAPGAEAGAARRPRTARAPG